LGASGALVLTDEVVLEGVEVVEGVGAPGGLREEVERLRRDLAEAREQQAATSGVLAVLGRATSDLDAVLETVVDSARHLCRADIALIFLLEGDTYRLAIASGPLSEEDRVYLAQHPLAQDRGTLTGRVGLERRPQQIADVLADPEYGRLDIQRHGGFRTTMGVPMLLDGEVVGVLVVWRTEVDPFSERATELLTTFATQAAIAIRNVDLVHALQARSAEVEVASRHKSEFLASMSHELRTPLNAVIGFSEVLLERMFGDLNDRQEDYLRDIWSSGKHLLELLNEILDLSKVEAGQMTLDPTEFSLQEALGHGLALVRERAARHGIRLGLEVAADVGPVRADELRIKQVIVNLLSNAVKFTPDGGRVEVRARTEGSEVLVTVADTGTGVAAEDRERIFESFQQGGRRASTTEGTGLGLTLSKRIVELHGGRIWVDSQMGVGSTFGFAIPAGVPAAAATGDDPGRADGQPTVVVIDDDRRSIDLLTVYAEAAGLRVVSAHDGRRGVELIKALQPAIVVLDILLPGLDGWQVLESLKADPATAAIPVVVVSILDERGRGLALGAADYLVKPVSREGVLDAFARCGPEATWPTS
jgi:signal transduction histidine kinase